MSSSMHPQPTTYVKSFSQMLSSVCAHAMTTKDLLVTSVHDSLTLIDWHLDPSHAQADVAWHHPCIVELAAPCTIAGVVVAFPASAAWQQANLDMYVFASFTLIDATLMPHLLFFSNINAIYCFRFSL